MLKHIYQLVIAWTIVVYSLAAHAQSIDYSLWKIEKVGQPTSYLLGTIHVGNEKSQLTTQSKLALNSSEKIIFEAPLPDKSKDNHAELLNQMINQMFNMQDSNNLQKQLGEKRYLTVKTFFNNPGLASYRPMLNFMNDWTLFSILLHPNDQNILLDYGIESLLLKEVSTQAVSYFEDVFFAPQLMQTIPKDELHIMIDRLMSDDNNNKEIYDQMIALYQANQIAQLTELVFNKELNLKGIPAQNRLFWEKWLYNDLLVVRTKAWLPQVLAQLPQQSTFIAVGLGHLVGEEGLVQLLRNNGYTVTAIR